MTIVSFVIVGPAMVQETMSAKNKSPQAPNIYSKALKNLEGFRIDDRDSGWLFQQNFYPCKTAKENPRVACSLLKATWNVRVIELIKRHDVGLVLQELWLLQYPSDAKAERAVHSLSQDWEWGPFFKQPYRLLKCGHYIMVIESRHRFPKPHTKLLRAVEKELGKHCKK